MTKRRAYGISGKQTARDFEMVREKEVGTYISTNSKSYDLQPNANGVLCGHGNMGPINTKQNIEDFNNNKKTLTTLTSSNATFIDYKSNHKDYREDLDD